MRTRQVEIPPRIIQKLKLGWCFWSTDLLAGVPNPDRPGCMLEKYDNPSEFVWVGVDEVMEVDVLYQRLFGIKPGSGTGILYPHLVWPLSKDEPLSFDEARRVGAVVASGYNRNELEQLENFYKDTYGEDSETRPIRKDTLLQYPIPYTDVKSTEHRWWPLSVQVIGQPVVPQDEHRREKTENLRAKPFWTPEDFRSSERRQMQEGADEDAPVGDVRDLSYDELADLFIVVLGTNVIGVCVVQLEDGVDKELIHNGEGRVEAWPLPMHNRVQYQEAYSRLTAYWRHADEGHRASLVPEAKRRAGLNQYVRKPLLVGEPFTPINEEGLGLLYNAEIGPGRFVRSKPDWDRLRERAKTLQASAMAELSTQDGVAAAQEELRKSGFVMVDADQQMIQDPNQFMSALWMPVGPEGVPPPPTIPEEPMSEAGEGSESFMHASQDSYWSATS